MPSGVPSVGDMGLSDRESWVLAVGEVSQVQLAIVDQASVGSQHHNYVTNPTSFVSFV